MERARGIGERAQSWNAAVSWRLQLYVLRREQGRLPEIEELVRRSVDDYPTYPIWRCVATHTVAALGHSAEARTRACGILEDDIAALPFDEEWLVGVSLLAEAVHLIDYAEGASHLYDRMLPYDDHVTVSYPEISVGFVSRYLGLLAMTLGRHDDAERHLEQALEAHERSGARGWLAHTRRDCARLLIARDAAGDAARAAELGSAAIDGYLALGMDHWADATRTLAMRVKH